MKKTFSNQNKNYEIKTLKNNTTKKARLSLSASLLLIAGLVASEMSFANQPKTLASFRKITCAGSLQNGLVGASELNADLNSSFDLENATYFVYRLGNIIQRDDKTMIPASGKSSQAKDYEYNLHSGQSFSRSFVINKSSLDKKSWDIFSAKIVEVSDQQKVQMPMNCQFVD